MKKIAFTLALMATLISCNNNQEATTTTNSGTSAPLSNEVPGEENIADLVNKPLSKGAEKFKGEFQSVDVDGIKTLIKEHPEKPGMLAVIRTFGAREPLTLSFWYDESADMLSSKEAKDQSKYYTIKLDPTGQTILNVHHNKGLNTADTTIYKRIR